MRLTNKVALVTGAARGIGAAIAEAFVAEGAFVYVTDLNDGEGARLASRLGAQAAYRHLDVRREPEWLAVTDAVIAERGRLDVLVNNAGVTGFESGFVTHDPERASLDDWR